jgi:IS1 family transposase
LVGSKKQNVWIWLALDAVTREVVGMVMGNRSAQLAQKLWESLPGVDRQWAICYADFWEDYCSVIPRIPENDIRLWAKKPG